MKKQDQADVGYEVVQTSRAFEEVMAQLRRLIVQGHLKAGDRLPAERDLAVRLGVSRNTIREALRGMEMAGVLELHKGAHGGAFLVVPNGKTVSSALQDMFQLGSVTPAQLTEARLGITASIVSVACQRIQEEDLLELERSVDEAKKATQMGDYVRRSRINLDFYRILARATDNPVFVAIMNGLISMMEHFVDTIGPPQGSAVFASRARLIGHLRARDAVAASAEMEKHLKGMHKEYLSRLELHTEKSEAKPAVKATAKVAAKAPARTAAKTSAARKKR